MKKVLIILFLNTALCGSSFAESYYFNKCQLTNILYADYLIDLDKNIIKVKLEAADGTLQEFSDQIEMFIPPKTAFLTVKFTHIIKRAILTSHPFGMFTQLI